MFPFSAVAGNAAMSTHVHVLARSCFQFSRATSLGVEFLGHGATRGWTPRRCQAVRTAGAPLYTPRSTACSSLFVRMLPNTCYCPVPSSTAILTVRSGISLGLSMYPLIVQIAILCLCALWPRRIALCLASGRQGVALLPHSLHGELALEPYLLLTQNAPAGG